MALGAIVGGALGFLGSRSAGRAQERAADASTALRREIYGETTGRLQPYATAGSDALNRLTGLLGVNGDFEMSPAAMFALTEGRDAIEAGAAARGGLYSGRSMEALERLRSGLAAQDRDNQVNRLFDLAGMGQSAAAGQGTAGINFARSAGDNILQAGNAQAASIMAGVNAINDGIGNYYGYNALNRLTA